MVILKHLPVFLAGSLSGLAPFWCCALFGCFDPATCGFDVSYDGGGDSGIEGLFLAGCGGLTVCLIPKIETFTNFTFETFHLVVDIRPLQVDCH